MESTPNHDSRLLLSASLTTGALASQVLFNYFTTRDLPSSSDPKPKGFIDPAADEPRSLTR